MSRIYDDLYEPYPPASPQPQPAPPKGKRSWGLLLLELTALAGGIFVALILPFSVAARWWYESTGIEAAVLTATPSTTTTSPTHSPEMTPFLSPTVVPTASATSVPVVHLLWDAAYSQVYLRKAPGGDVLLLVDNGSQVSILTREDAWVQVHLNSDTYAEDLRIGWVAANQVYTITSQLPSAQVAGESGANLRHAPGGDLAGWLPPGTPVQIIETAETNDTVWVHVILPDERGGWVAGHLLSYDEP